MGLGAVPCLAGDLAHAPGVGPDGTGAGPAAGRVDGDRALTPRRLCPADRTAAILFAPLVAEGPRQGLPPTLRPPVRARRGPSDRESRNEAKMDFLAELGIEAENSGAYAGTWLETGGEVLESRSPATGEL